jgi:glutathione S-transferase
MVHLILHEDPRSGNCYKIRLTAAHLGVPLEIRSYDIMQGETRRPEFLANISANGRIPVLQEGDKFLPESNAACFYLAEGSPLVPAGRFERADMLRWMFWEQYNHEPNVATLRFWLAFIGEERLNDLQRQQLPGKREAGEAALALMDRHLTGRAWFVGNTISLADIALYAYTHVAGDGGYELSEYPAVCAWMDRLAAHPRHVAMNTETPLAIGGTGD